MSAYLIAIVFFALGFGASAIFTNNRDEQHDEHEEFPGC